MSNKRSISSVLALLVDIKKFPGHFNVALERNSESLYTLRGLPSLGENYVWRELSLPRAHDLLLGYILGLREGREPVSTLTFGTPLSGSDVV